ncbi:hypothetical protein RND81_10G199300 [Saponaria officinalis]|uniref:Uncharacterized protein n=1 Tax=Saponaria officinalis TaxID=3572 RepID=A0AAW1I6M9_SAPOF
MAKAQPQNGAQLTVFNQTLSTLSFVKSIKWSGKVSSPGYPPSIGPGAAGMFSHLKTSNFGSEAAVVYSGTNAAMQPCAWILAWYAPADSSDGNKVYVFCGPKTLIDSMTDDQIRMSLESSLDTSNATNLGTKTSANATINDKMPNMATVGANFALIP